MHLNQEEFRRNRRKGEEAEERTVSKKSPGLKGVHPWPIHCQQAWGERTLTWVVRYYTPAHWACREEPSMFNGGEEGGGWDNTARDTSCQRTRTGFSKPEAGGGGQSRSQGGRLKIPPRTLSHGGGRGSLSKPILRTFFLGYSSQTAQRKSPEGRGSWIKTWGKGRGHTLGPRRMRPVPGSKQESWQWEHPQSYMWHGDDSGPIVSPGGNVVLRKVTEMLMARSP